MRKNLNFKLFSFLIPLLLLLLVFSLYPIVTSFVYSTFNYQTNDQQLNRLRTSISLNANLFVEDAGYVSYFLADDIPLVSPEDQTIFKGIGTEGNRMAKEFKGVTQPNAAQAKEIKQFIGETQKKLDAVYDRYPKVKFNRRNDLNALLKDMDKCFNSSNFIGVSHYETLMHDSRFFADLWHTLLFTLVTVTVELILGMLLALIMNKAVRGIGLVRTTALIPWAVPTAVAALMWQYLYDGSNGIVSRFFAQLRLIPTSDAMLSSGGGAMAGAMLADIWKTTPYMALLLLAGLQVIDRALYESASVDGSTKVHAFFKITLPLMKPSILVALLFRTLDAFRVYDLIAILTGGGPGGATETLSIYSYKVMISQNNYGYGSAIVIAMFVCVALIALLYIKVLGAEMLSDE